MKNLLKLLLVLALCCTVFCQDQNELSLDMDAFSVSVGDNFVPFFKVVREDAVYYLRLLSIYEIQQQNDSLWYRVPGTETPFNALNWNISSSLADGTFSLMGSACPCDGVPEQQEPVFNRRSTLGKRHHGHSGGDNTPPGNQGIDDEGDNGASNPIYLGCPTVNFDYVKLVFQIDPNCQSSSGNQGTDGGNNGGNNTNNCNNTCVEACNNADNVTACVAYCSDLINVTYLDEAICNTTCTINDTPFPDCLVACNAFSICLNESTGGNTDCNNSCVEACNNADNVTSCVAYCSNFIDVTYLDEAICNTTCLINDTADPDCLVACNSFSICLNNSTGNETDCNSTCADACNNADNVTACVAYCSNFINETELNETICNTTCLVEGVADPDCLVACNSFSICLNNSTGNETDCNSTCADACSNADNVTACVAYCSNFINETELNETICNTTCLIEGVADPDCLVACNAFSTCLNSTTPPSPVTPSVCAISLNYVLFNYQWSNISSGSNSTNGTRLAFAFEVVPEPTNVRCKASFDYWYEGPFSLQLNASSYATQGDDFSDISNATSVESNLVWALRDNVIVGRLYLEQFESGYNIFNPVQSFAQPNNTDGGSDGGNTPAKRGVPYSFPI